MMPRGAARNRVAPPFPPSITPYNPDSQDNGVRTIPENQHDTHTRTSHPARYRARRTSVRSPHHSSARLRCTIRRNRITGSVEQTAAKQLAKQLSEAYSRVSIVRNGDVVTLNDPNRSQDSGTSIRQHRRMTPRVSLPNQYQAPVTSVKDQGATPSAGRSEQHQPSNRTYCAKPKAPRSRTATAPAAPPFFLLAASHRMVW